MYTTARNPYFIYIDADEDERENKGKTGIPVSYIARRNVEL